MTIRKYTFLLFLLLSSSLVFSQFSLSTELKYLQIVNEQNNNELIEDNLNNAEFFVDSLLLQNQNNTLKSEFFYELSKSYYRVEKYDLALFSLLRQRCLFPNEVIQKQSEQLFKESAYSNNLSDSLIHIFYSKSQASKIPKSLKERYNLLLNLACQINTKHLSPYIYKTGLIYRSLEPNTPIWYQHWEFLTQIKLKPKHIKEALTFAKTDQAIYSQINQKKLKYKVYRKAIKHYRKHHAYQQSKQLLDEYKNFKLGFFRRIDVWGKSILALPIFR